MTHPGLPVRSAPAPAHRPPPRVVVAAVALAALVTAALAATIPIGGSIWMLEVDFKVYDLTGSAVLHGVSPYDIAADNGFQFIYPPFAALLLIPLALTGVHVGFVLWTFLSVLALEAAAWLAMGLVEESPDRRAKYALLATAVALPSGALVMHLNVGQITVFLMLLVLFDLTRRPGRAQGVAIGIAAGIKLTPLIFIAYLLLTRRFRAAAVATASFLATVLIGFLVMPGASVAWWGGLVLDTDRMKATGAAAPFNQSLHGVLDQLPGPLSAQGLWVALALLVGVAGLAVAAWAHRRGLEAAGVLACAVTGLLISPLSWPQHWVWLVPGFALWMWWARRRRSAAHAAGVVSLWLVTAAAGVLTYVVVVAAPDLAVAFDSVPGSKAAIVLLHALQLLAGLAFLGVLAAVLRRADRPAGPRLTARSG
ncbi:glycosyltransferase 87 family protein [Actinosynnema sp. NPDC053489]|uniref:glycosyltransferase 87 family protein n=1 Tax=Actinosynnema sp. NPDC053489 TaxID=3363916 RepID=UPI0037C565B2